MSIERSRNRMRPPGPVTPRPDGISRRVATAARDRRPGPLPEQRPTGWHRVVYDNPLPPARPEPARSDDPMRGGSGSLEREQVVEGTVPTVPAGPRQPAHPGHQQVGRVLGLPPAGRTRRAALVLAATVGAAAAAAMAAVVLVAGASGPERTGPGEIGPDAPATVEPVRPSGSSPAPGGSTAAGPSSTSAPEAVPPAGPAEPAAEPGAGVPPTEPAPATEPDPARVTTLGPGDAGFGWPSTAFGSAGPAAPTG